MIAFVLRLPEIENISTKNSKDGTEVEVDLNNGSHHSITIENGSKAQNVANALRALADKIAP